MVTEQIANLSAGNRRPGSNPGLSADVKSQCESAGFFCSRAAPWVVIEFHLDLMHGRVVERVFFGHLAHE